MEKKVVILTGSPRKDGNTDLMAASFAEAAQKSGHSVTMIRTADLNIQGCMACEGCFSQGKPCCYDDDFNNIAPLIEQADVVVFAAPLYFFTFPAQIKRVIDRCYSLLIGQRPIQKKECVLLTCGEDTSERAFDGMFRTYDLMADYLQWRDLGKLYVTGVQAAGDIRNTDGLERAARLGASL